jgi:RNA polymerase sigma-70 factor (ECF subfamily)
MSDRSPEIGVAVMTDEALMGLYAAGNGAAFDELFRRFEAPAYAFFVKRTRSPECARDLYQELFLRIHQARDSFDPARPFAPWFFQIARNLLIDDRRRAYRSAEVAIGDRDPVAEQMASDDQLSARREVHEVLSGLSPAERLILVSSSVAGVGYSRLAIDLGKSRDAIKKIASRAMQRVRAAADDTRSIRSMCRR